MRSHAEGRTGLERGLGFGEGFNDAAVIEATERLRLNPRWTMSSLGLKESERGPYLRLRSGPKLNAAAPAYASDGIWGAP